MTHPWIPASWLNERTYPNLLRLFEQLSVAVAPSESRVLGPGPDAGSNGAGAA